MKTSVVAAAALLWGIVAGCGARAAAPPAAVPAGPPLRATVDAHLRAIETRSLDALLATVDDRDVLVILPNGKTIGSRAELEAMHRAWFAETDWTMKLTVERVVETAELGYALTTYTYTDPQGTRSRWLLLVFRRTNGAWKLIHDQNTARD